MTKDMLSMNKIMVYYAILFLAKSVFSLDINNITNCTYTPVSEISPSFNYWSTVIQTTLTIVQVVTIPTNFLADWLFYHKHHNEKVVAAKKEFDQVREQQNIIRQKGEDLLGHILDEIEKYLLKENSSVNSKEEAFKALKRVKKFLKKMADSNNPIEVEIEGQ